MTQELILALIGVTTTASTGILGYVAKTLAKTVRVVDRLDERTTQHGERIAALEDKVAS